MIKKRIKGHAVVSIREMKECPPQFSAKMTKELDERSNVDRQLFFLSDNIDTDFIYLLLNFFERQCINPRNAIVLSTQGFF